MCFDLACASPAGTVWVSKVRNLLVAPDIDREMEPTDSDLWGAAGRGDQGAFRLLFDRHARPISNFAFRRTGDWSAAEEILAMVFMEAWRRRQEVRLSGDSVLPLALWRGYQRALEYTDDS